MKYYQDIWLHKEVTLEKYLWSIWFKMASTGYKGSEYIQKSMAIEIKKNPPSHNLEALQTAGNNSTKELGKMKVSLFIVLL